MPDSMGKMIQMITTLAEMQDRRKRLALEQDQFEEQKKQFAQQMGFNEKGQQQSAALKLLDAISNGGVDAHTAAPKLAQMLGFSPDQAQVFSQAAPNASAAAQMFATQQQQQGLASMTPQMQQQAQQQAYLTNQAQTTPGAMATSNLQAQLAGTQISPELARRAGEGFVMRQATGQTPFEFGMGQAALDQNLAPQAASIAAGITPSWMNQAQDAYWRASLAGSEREALMRAQASKQVDMGSYASLVNAAHQIQNDIALGKYGNDKYKQHAIGLYNNMARILGLDFMTGENAPESTGIVKQGVNKLRGMDYPGVTPQKPDSIYRPPNFF